MLQTIVISFHLMVVIALVAVVLLQRSEGGALGMGGGGGFMTGRGQANVLTRATAILAALFFTTSLGLTLIARYGRANRLDFNGASRPGTSEPAPKLPPTQPNSVLDQVRALEQQRNQPGSAAPGAATGYATSGAATPKTTTSGSATPAPASPSNAAPLPGTANGAAPLTSAEPSGMPNRPAPASK